MIDAVIRLLSVWLAEESEIMREEVLHILPFLFTHVMRQSEPIDVSSIEHSETSPSSSLLMLLLPGVLRLTASTTEECSPSSSSDPNRLRVVDVLLRETDALSVTFPLLLRGLRMLTTAASTSSTSLVSKEIDSEHQMFSLQLLLRLSVLLIQHLSRLTTDKCNAIIALLLQHLHLFDFHFQRCAGSANFPSLSHSHFFTKHIHTLSRNSNLRTLFRKN